MHFKTLIFLITLISFATLLFNEYFIYYVVLAQCRWPTKVNDSVRAMLLADTHLLGPFKGHWFDKLRREWQMRRSFQSAVWLHQPDVVFILGDVFDEGQWVNGDYFEIYLRRFHDIFRAPRHIKVYSAVGNHDIGFHYRLHPYVVNRFEKAFNESSNTLITIKNNHFVLLNSMTLSRDGCYFCAKAEEEIRQIGRRLKCAREKSNSTACKSVREHLPFYARPILLQHFPTFRKSDEDCIEHDSPEIEMYRENWEVLSKDATEFLGKNLKPLVAFSGHSHNYCRIINSLAIEEFTIASFSWRNKKNPSFMLAEFEMDKYAVSKCDMPSENTVISIYIASGFTVVVSILAFFLFKLKPKYKMLKRGKDHSS